MSHADTQMFIEIERSFIKNGPPVSRGRVHATVVSAESNIFPDLVQSVFTVTMNNAAEWPCTAPKDELRRMMRVAYVQSSAERLGIECTKEQASELLHMFRGGYGFGCVELQLRGSAFISKRFRVVDWIETFYV